MEEKLKAAGWYFAGKCSCSPKKYSYRHTNHSYIKIKIIRSYNKYEIYRHNQLIAAGVNTNFTADMSVIGLPI